MILRIYVKKLLKVFFSPSSSYAIPFLQCQSTPTHTMAKFLDMIVVTYLENTFFYKASCLFHVRIFIMCIDSMQNYKILQTSPNPSLRCWFAFYTTQINSVLRNLQMSDTSVLESNNLFIMKQLKSHIEFRSR